MRIYICSPLKGDIINNVKRAENIAYTVIWNGFTPIVPHQMAYYLDDDNKQDRELAIENCLKLVEICDILLVYSRNITSGMLKEIDKAKQLNKKVVFIDNLEHLDKKLKQLKAESGSN